MGLRTALERYTAPFVALVLGLAVLATGQTVTAVVFGLAALVLAWWTSPLRGRGGATHAGVSADPDAHPVVIYWRPGCTFCARLKAALGRRKREATWVNIWTDTEAAAYVRSVNDGNETVPTVVVRGTAYTNPDPALVKDALAAA